MLTDIRVDERLWVTSMMPKGSVERWFAADGGWVARGEKVAEVRIEDCLHEMLAPAGGRLTIFAKENSIVEPGVSIGVLDSRSAQGASPPHQ